MTERKRTYEHASPHSGMVQRIDSHCMGECDRQIAEQYLRGGEFMADLICRARQNLRSAASIVSKSFARRAKSE